MLASGRNPVPKLSRWDKERETAAEDMHSTPNVTVKLVQPAGSRKTMAAYLFVEGNETSLVKKVIEGAKAIDEARVKGFFLPSATPDDLPPSYATPDNPPERTSIRTPGWRKIASNASARAGSSTIGGGNGYGNATGAGGAGAGARGGYQGGHANNNHGGGSHFRNSSSPAQQHGSGGGGTSKRVWCSRCNRIDYHFAKQCTYPCFNRGYVADAHGFGLPGKPTICIMYQLGKCRNQGAGECFSRGATLAHVCSLCAEPHPGISCNLAHAEASAHRA